MKKLVFILTLTFSLNVFAQKTNVLFFGNSITASGVPETLVQLAEAGGDSIFAEQYWGGQLLYEYVRDAGMIDATKSKLAEKPWDYVVLQEKQSGRWFLPWLGSGLF